MTKTIESFVDASHGSLDLTRIDAAIDAFGSTDGNKRTKKARSCLDEHSGEAHSKLGETITVTFIDSHYETLSAKLTQVIAKLSEAIIFLVDAMSGADTLEQIGCRPVVEQTSGIEQGFQKAEYAVVVQLDARQTTSSPLNGLGEFCRSPGVDGGVEQLGLLLQVAVFSSASHREPTPRLRPVRRDRHFLRRLVQCWRWDGVQSARGRLTRNFFHRRHGQGIPHRRELGSRLDRGTSHSLWQRR